ncbi:MAG: hypothetical protein ACO1RX_14705 [Candidatus Sericytochromatia bacterium]
MSISPSRSVGASPAPSLPPLSALPVSPPAAQPVSTDPPAQPPLSPTPTETTWEGTQPPEAAFVASEVAFAETPAEAPLAEADDPFPAAAAREKLLSLLSPEQQEAWKAIDPLDINAVAGFLDQQNGDLSSRARFSNAYLQAHFSHAGDVNWGGASLEEAVAHAPRDASGRPGLDCEAFTALGRRLLGETNYTALAVSTQGPGQPRDHEVGLLRGDKAVYLVNNQQVLRLPGSPSDSDEALLSRVKLSDPIADPNGDMAYDTAYYRVGQRLQDAEAGLDIEVLAVRSATELDVRITGGTASYGARQQIDPTTGASRYLITPQAGDVLPLAENELVMRSATEGVERLPDGSFGGRYQVSTNAEGELAFTPLD